MTHAGLWDLQKVRTDYTGYAVRAGLAADSGATTLDIGFLADGSFDMATYSAFGTGSERIVKWYDQSGNGLDLSHSWSATLCPIVRTSAYNGKPSVYFNGGSLANAGFTDWNGSAHVNVIAAIKPGNTGAGYLWAGGGQGHGSYFIVNGTSGQNLWQQWQSSCREFYNYATGYGGSLYSWLYDGTQGTAANRLKLNFNTVDMLVTSTVGTTPATFESETGFVLNGIDGGQALIADYFAVYYLGQATDAPTLTALESSLNTRYLSPSGAQLFCLGDSLTSNSANGGAADPDAYANLLTDNLDSGTAIEWSLYALNSTSEGGADTERVLELNSVGAGALVNIDTHYGNSVTVCWAGTNDLYDGDSAATALTGSVALAQACKDWGATVYYINMLPRLNTLNDPVFEASRVTYNAGLAAAMNGIATVIDVASLPQLDDPTDTNYYLGDQVHLNDAGNAVVAAAVAAVIEANLN